MANFFFGRKDENGFEISLRLAFKSMPFSSRLNRYNLVVNVHSIVKNLYPDFFFAVVSHSIHRPFPGMRRAITLNHRSSFYLYLNDGLFLLCFRRMNACIFFFLLTSSFSF